MYLMPVSTFLNETEYSEDEKFEEITKVPSAGNSLLDFSINIIEALFDVWAQRKSYRDCNPWHSGNSEFAVHLWP